MNLNLDGLVLLIIAAALFVLVVREISRGRHDMTADRLARWASAIADAEGAERIFLAAGRRVAAIPAVHEQGKSPAYRSLEGRLLAAGVFGGSVEVYLATQLAGILGAVFAVLIAMALGLSGIYMLFALIAATILAYWPFDRVKRGAEAKADAVRSGLPDFAEMLTLPLSQGSSPLRAMEFAAAETKGPVAEEARVLVQALRTNTLDPAQAFELAAMRLGTPEARALFSTLMRAQVDGIPVVGLLREQAKAMRNTEYQHRREQNKKLPTKLVLVFGAHFMPMLLIVVLVPIFLALGSVS